MALESLRKLLPAYDSDARFAAIFNQTSAGIAETDLSGRFVLVNPCFCQIVGRSQEELLALRMQDITYPDDLPGSIELFQRMISTGENFVIEKRYLRPDGEIVWVRNNVSLIRTSAGAPQYAIAVTLELTAGKRADQAARRGEELARRMIESSSDCIKLLDLEGRLLSMSAPGQKALNICDLSPFVNAPWAELWSEWRELAKAAITAARSGEAGSFTGFCPTVTGTPKWWDNTVTPILDAAGKPESLLAVSRDVTERHIEEEARDLLIEAAKATGAQFFESLAQAIARVFDARYVIVGELKPHSPGIVATLAVCDRGKPAANFEYALEGLPCEEALEKDLCFYAEGVRKHFPNQPLLERLEVESYVGKPLHAANGDAIGLLAIIHDEPLKPNRRTEEILEIFVGRAGAEMERLRSRRIREERELLLRVVTDHAPMLIAYVGRDHCYRFSNHTCHLWFGVDEISGRRVRDVIGEEAYGKLAPRLESALAGNEVTFEDFVPYPDHGRYVQTTYVPHRDPQGEVQGLVAIVQDVSERHRAERVTEFLAEANSLLSGSLDYEQALSKVTHLIVPSIADWCVVDALRDDGTLDLIASLHWHPEKNQLIREMRNKHPLKPDSPVGVPLVARTGCPIIYENVGEDLLKLAAENDDHLDMLRRLYIRSAIMVPLTLRGKTLAIMTLVSGESHYHFSQADLPMLEELARRCALVMENARLYSAAQQEIAVRAQAESALQDEIKRKDDFLAILGHELRNPLAPIRNCLDILQRSDFSREQVQRTRETMVRQVRHMGKLIDDLLDVSRISQGKIPIDRDDTDLAQVVRDTVEDYQDSFNAKSLQLNLSAPASPVWISGDPVRISQALINLLRNAVSFTDPGGTISVSLREENGEAVLSVADNGVGIEPHVLKNLFKAFSQADRSLVRSRGGLGLGLAVVKGIIELHDGSVSAASEGLGHGAQFTVRLPLIHERVEPAPRSDSAAARRRLQVLVIEDNRDAADTLEVLLELLGHEGRVAYDGAQGLALARDFKPDVVLCDLGLPGELSGFSVAKAMRESLETRMAYLVAVTGYGGEHNKKHALDAGFDRHLCKPIGAEALEQLFAALPT
ncbi:MAG: PAS domain-containing protein [Burkholderiales bacterium]